MPAPSFSSPRHERIDRFSFSPELKNKIANATRCFIVGLGPSLAKVNHEALRDELVIGVNFVLKTDFTPDIICISDPGRIDFENLKPGCPKVVTVNHVYRRHPEVFDQIETYHDIEFVDAGSKRQNAATVADFHPNMEEIYWAASVIAELAVPFASYLGMKEIYILGLDGARASFPATHVWGSDPNLGGPHASTLFHLHEQVANQAKRKGTSVFNASFGGVVEAFKKVSLADVKPDAVRRVYPGKVDGKIIVWKGNPFVVKPEGEIVRIADLKGTRFVRHNGGKVHLDAPDGSEEFRADTSWIVEPSFVNRDWISVRAVNLPDAYISSWDGVDTYRVRSPRQVFSPYFSSFRLFDSLDQAQQKMDADRMLQSIENQRALLGNMMVRNDKASS